MSKDFASAARAAAGFIKGYPNRFIKSRSGCAALGILAGGFMVLGTFAYQDHKRLAESRASVESLVASLQDHRMSIESHSFNGGPSENCEARRVERVEIAPGEIRSLVEVHCKLFNAPAQGGATHSL